MRVTLIALSLVLLLLSCAEETELERTRRLANAGDASAQCYLGWMYMEGEGVPQDYKEAVKWYRLSADQGDADAQYNLGVMYMEGEGVPQDYKEAVKWYRMAADQGDADAQFNLGTMYDNGEGVPQDYKEAVKWYRMAADQGHVKAQFNLGLRYFKGQGVPQDFKETYAWWSVAKTSVAKTNGSEFAAKHLGKVTKKMTKEQIADAMSLATEIQNRIEANRKD